MLSESLALSEVEWVATSHIIVSMMLPKGE